MLPIALEFVDKVLDLEAHPRFNLSVGPFFEHGLEAVLEVVETHHGLLGFVLFLSSFSALGLVLAIAILLWLVLCVLGCLDLDRGLVDRAVGLVLAGLARQMHLVRGQRVEHGAENLDIASVGELLE